MGHHPRARSPLALRRRPATGAHMPGARCGHRDGRPRRRLGGRRAGRARHADVRSWEGQDMTGPLDGVRVLELCEGVAGPWCAMQLGDAGADVVKIEPPEGDFARRLGPPFERGESVLFLALNRSKRGVVLDLNLPDGRSQLRALLGTADILLHDRTPAAAAALGLDEAALRAEHPRLVVCALTDFGPEGPWRERLGSELVAQAAAECPAS